MGYDKKCMMVGVKGEIIDKNIRRVGGAKVGKKGTELFYACLVQKFCVAEVL